MSEGGQAVSGKYWFHSIVPERTVLAPCDMKTKGEDKKLFTTNKSVDRDFMGRLQPPASTSPFSKKKFNLFVGGNEKIKAKQNKIKIARCLTGTKL